MKRETAWRVFAGEYNDSSFEIKGEGEMTPSYVVTPLGAKVNRLFFIGVLTDVENISEGGDLVRAHVSDPTGVFTVYSGSYQKEVTDVLVNIDAPAFVAVVGKVRTYTPEEGTMYVSIRPERIIEVDANTRDKWILETCKNTKDRIEAIFEAMKMNESNEHSLKKLGFSKELCEGVIYALKNYKDIDLNKYVRIIQESLQFLRPDKESLPEITKDEKLDVEDIIQEPEEEQSRDETDEQTDVKSKQSEKEENEEDSTENENTVLEIIKNLEGNDGAAWDTITKKCEKKGLDKDTVEEALTSLMDKGLIYEPVLGTIKTT
jgi:RPA family protein